MGSEERQKSKLVGVRLSVIEYAELEEKAETRGISVPAYLRQAALDKVETRPRRSAPPWDVKLLSSAVGALGKIGNNLNQIAKRLNEGGGVGLERIFLALETLNLTMNEILKAIKGRNDNQRKEP